MNGPDREQIAQWVEKQRDDVISEDEFRQLQQALTDDPEARELYLDLMHQSAHLRLERVHLSASGALSSEPSSAQSNVPTPKTTKTVWLSAVAALAAGLLMMLWWNLPREIAPGPEPTLAQVVESSDAEWGDCSLPSAVGSKLGRGHLQINRGLAMIRFASGAEVTLESPAVLEIQSPLQGHLLRGTAVVDVPDSAHGFTLTTPTAVAIDYGTAFAVTVDTASQTSAIEVLEGEVEVQHVATKTSLRLKEKQRVLASETDLSDSAVSMAEAKRLDMPPAATTTSGMQRITTADGKGGDASISRGRDADVRKNSHPDLVLIKHSFDGYERFSRKGYFRFDLASLQGKEITSAKFLLTLRPSGLGFASGVGDCEFIVYGLTDETGDDWSSESLTWQSAPANLDGAAEVDTARTRELGRFTVRRGVQHGQVSIDGTELVRFLSEDTNQSVTLILVRETKETVAGGLVHGFAKPSNPDGIPPTLLLTTDEN